VGWVWLVAAPLLDGLSSFSRNERSVWGYLFGLAAVGAGLPWWVTALYAGMILALGSRGALVGLLAGLAFYHWPRVPVRLRWPALALAPVLIIGLTLVNPSTAAFRWFSSERAVTAIAAWPWGYGPGGPLEHGLISGIVTPHTWDIRVAQPKYDPAPVEYDPASEGDFPHAHNIALDAVLMLGVQGALIVLVALGWWLRRASPPRWALAVLVAVVVHGLVDTPVWYPWILAGVLGVMGVDRRGEMDMLEERKENTHAT